jgi:hypothetical protein
LWRFFGVYFDDHARDFFQHSAVYVGND